MAITASLKIAQETQQAVLTSSGAKRFAPVARQYLDNAILAYSQGDIDLNDYLYEEMPKARQVAVTEDIKTEIAGISEALQLSKVAVATALFNYSLETGFAYTAPVKEETPEIETAAA